MRTGGVVGMSTRRAFLAALPAVAAAATLPAIAGVSYSHSQLASMHLNGRRVLVDLSDLPKQSTIVDEETVTEWRPRGVIEHASEPDVEAEYVVLTNDGDILITRLEPSYSLGPADPRRGFMSGTHMGYRAWLNVRVLGKVVSEG